AQGLLTALQGGDQPLLLPPLIGRGQPIEPLSRGVLVLALGIGRLGDAVLQLAGSALSSAGRLLALVPLPARQPQRSDGNYQRQQGRSTATAGIAWFVPRTGGGVLVRCGSFVLRARGHCRAGGRCTVFRAGVLVV